VTAIAIRVLDRGRIGDADGTPESVNLEPAVA
jgi:hypothetical protein